jgi:ABC-2 type transport system ATP-binding protein
MIRAEGISKWYGRFQALYDLTFNVEEGSIVSMIGANGAGKSTLFDIITTLDSDFKGKMLVGGHDTRRHKSAIRKLTGYVPGTFSLYSDLTVMENVDFFANAYGCGREALYKMTPRIWSSLEQFVGYRASQLSGGMRQKLTLCCATVHSPSILLLDEPTTGIDPLSRWELWQELLALREQGITIVMSTHYLDEAARADKVMLLDKGRLISYDTPKNLTPGEKSLEDVFIKFLESTDE